MAKEKGVAVPSHEWCPTCAGAGEFVASSSLDGNIVTEEHRKPCPTCTAINAYADGRELSLQDRVLTWRNKALHQSLNAPEKQKRNEWTMALCVLEEVLPDDLRLSVNRGVRGVVALYSERAKDGSP